MSTTSSPTGVMHRLAVPGRCLSLLLATVTLTVGSTRAQPLAWDEASPPPESVQTVAAPCSLPSASRIRAEQRVRDVLFSWTKGIDGSGAVDRVVQQLVDEAAGFAVTDGTLLRLPRTSPSGSFIVPGIACHERAEQRVLEEILQRDPDVVPVLFAFYLRLYERQVTPPPDRLWLASRTRDRMSWLMTRHRQEHGRGEESRRQRGRMLLMLADAMQLAPYHVEIVNARYLADEIVDLWPDSLAARYMAATLAERTGDYRAAARRLAQLAKRAPDDQEVRLRLAINRARTGEKRSAREALRDLARDSAEDWIRILAFEEWGRVATGESAEETPESILREALEAFPTEPQLTLQLAAVWVAEGRWSEAEGVLGMLSKGGTAKLGESPRRRYDRLRREELVEEAERLDEIVEARMPSLQRILAGSS